jgi:putative membrane-bound dehydrogenase-like protein
MKRLFLFLSLFVFLAAGRADPLRVFIRGGKKSHGPEAHEHQRFLEKWQPLLTERGMKVDGALEFPTPEQLAATDVLVMYAQDGGNITPEQRPALETFIKRGGGIVLIHTASVANTPETSSYWKATIGGSWVQGKTKWKEGPMDLYFTENQRLDGGHPITKGASNFHLDDEIYYDMDLAPDIRVLATSYTPNVKEGKKPAEGGKANIYDIQPQMWTYERTADGGTQPYRAFVSIPGHLWSTFERPNYRAILLRGIAWAGKRANVDEFTKPEEIGALTYPDGGPEKPADTLANLEVHPDFNMKLVAAEPLITKPMCIDWDPAGRLWVAETPEYPNGRRGMRPDYRGKEWKDHGGIEPEPGEQQRKAQDKISILIDTDGDGVMDKKQVFYEGLELVTGFVFHEDGVIVTQAPDILFIHDPGPDGKARKVETLYHGLGTRDTHAVINNPRWGWDGWIYATHGYSSSSDVKNAQGEMQGTIGSGVVRFRPDGSKIEQYSSKGGNTWGLTITGDNRVMWTQPTSGQLLMQTVLPEYALARGKIGNTTSFKVVEPSLKTFPLMSWEQMAYVQIDWVGSFTAAAGCAIYDGGTWPAEYHGDYFCTEPTINIIHHARLTPEGSSYTFHKLPGREETEFVRSKDMWWRPIEVRIGPDGAMYVCDFYNQAVIHNDTRGPDHNGVNAAVRPDRDHYFGRIWRIDHKKAEHLAVPDLSKATIADLAKALEHPNRVVRMTASRLLIEQSADPEAIEPVVKSTDPDARIAALWTLSHLGSRDSLLAVTRTLDASPAVRRNAANVLENNEMWTKAMEPLLTDEDGQVRVAALRALAASEVDDAGAQAVVQAWPRFDDDFQRSAAVGAASRNPVGAISSALSLASEEGSARAPRAGSGAPPEPTPKPGAAANPKSGAARAGDDAFGGAPKAAREARALPDGSSLVPLVAELARGIGERDEIAAASKIVIALAAKTSSDQIKRIILETLGRSLKTAPELTPKLSTALGALLESSVSDAALPLAAQWDKSGALKAKVSELTGKLLAQLTDANGEEAARLAAARSLVGIRGANAEILPAVVRQLGEPGSANFKRALIATLAEADDTSVGASLAAAFGKLPADVQPSAFDAVLKRADWTNAFLDAVKAKQIDPAMLGPANAFRLRSHPDKAVAKRAIAMLDELNPTAKLKKDAIAKLMPIVGQKGDPAKGKAPFTTTCAICHKFGDFGAEIGPGLTGMGAHGASELLGAIVDPNAEVDPAFTQWNIETKDGVAYAGVIAAENPTTITLKSLAGVQQVKVADIKSRVNTGRSLMPEGFEGLGAETLRDIISYLQSVDGGKFRTVDLRDAFTASTSGGIYNTTEAKRDSFEFTKTGTVQVAGVPFNIVSADKAPLNILVLKGGPEKSYSASLAPRVEAKLGGFTANRLHFLGGVAGWGSKGKSEPRDLVKCTVQYADGQKETLVFRDGVEFADYIAPIEVPGSKLADGLVKSHQLRWFSKQLTRTAPIEKLVLESVETHAAATFVAITAELADANAAPLPTATAEPTKAGPNSGTLTVAAPVGEDANFKPQFDDAVPQPPATRPASGPRVLLVGGGSSHDFVKFMGASDKATLTPSVGWVDFTQNLNGIYAILDRIDVLVLSANQPISSATKKALLAFANAGKGIIALHPGTWYAWKNFSEWNAQIVGGGTRGHDALGPYTVKITKAAHPITKGVTASFEITDELYNYTADPSGNPIEVLAEATSPKTGKTFPQVFMVKHPKSRIVGLTLGHDARAHDLPEYQALLKNAVHWADGN